MCGIFGYFGDIISGRNIPIMTSELFDKLGQIAQLRGNDGWGAMVGNYSQYEPQSRLFKFNKKSFVEKSYYGMLNCRAKPETEVESSEKQLQPIRRHSSYLVHNGSLSEKYVRDIYKKYNWEPSSGIDSEALLCMVKNEGNDSKSLSKVDGGFSFIYMQNKGGELKVSIACKYQPLFELIVDVQMPADDCGVISTYYYYHSCKEGIDEIKKYFEKSKEEWFGDFYITFREREFPEYSYVNYEVSKKYLKKYSGTFIPKFQYGIQVKPTKKIKVLCATSSGIDSTTSLMLANELLSMSNVDYSIDAIHFKYGHRGQDAEEFAIRNVIANANSNIHLKVVDLEPIYKNFFNVKGSQLIDKTAKIETGTQDKLKSTIAWVPVRNMLFQTLMIGMAETYILEEGYDKVYLIAGWNQLSEEGFYPDNSARFSNTMLKAAKFGTLVGHKIHTWNLCSNLLKADQWLLADYFKFLHLFKYTISCDIPIIKYDDEGNVESAHNCNGQCGSTLLSMWASQRYIDIKDPREFAEAVGVVDKDLLYKPPTIEPKVTNEADVKNAISRLILIPEVHV